MSVFMGTQAGEETREKRIHLRKRPLAQSHGAVLRQLLLSQALVCQGAITSSYLCTHWNSEER